MYADARHALYNALGVLWLHAASHDAWKYNLIRWLTSWRFTSHFRVLKVVRVVRSLTNLEAVGERSPKFHTYEEKTHDGI